MTDHRLYSSKAPSTEREISRDEPFDMHPGEYIEAATRMRDLTPEEFAQECRIDLELVLQVFNKSIIPNDDFIQKTRRVFPEAWQAFRAYVAHYLQDHPNQRAHVVGARASH